MAAHLAAEYVHPATPVAMESTPPVHDHEASWSLRRPQAFEIMEWAPSVHH
jgi:hypothetical protein